MVGVIERQIQSLHASAFDLRAAGVAPQGPAVAAACREVDDLLAVAVALYERVQAGVRQWQASAADWEAADWVDQAREFEGRYRALQGTFERVGGLLAQWEAGGCRPEGAGRFRQAKLDLDLLCQLSVDRMLAADDSQRQGKGRPMAEVRDELRRRLGA